MRFVTSRGRVALPTKTDDDRIKIASNVGYFVPAVIDSVVAGDPAAADAKLLAGRGMALLHGGDPL